MKKYLLVLALLLAGIASFAVIGGADHPTSTREPSAKEERREVREKRRAERLEKYEKLVDSLVLSRNWQFNPQTMQQLPAGSMRILSNPNFTVGIWDGTVDICLPYIKGFVPPYTLTILNYTVPSVDHYFAEQTAEGWSVSFETSLFSASTYTFTFEISSRIGGVTLTVTNPWYNTVQYTGTLSQLY
jgi:hypothetical protein